MSRIIRMLVAVAAAFGLAALGLALGAPSASAGAGGSQVFYVRVLNVPDGNDLYTNGAWSDDNINRTFVVTEVSPGTYDVRTFDIGTWQAAPGVNAPLDPTGATAMGNERGPLLGGAELTVTGAQGPPSAANLKPDLMKEGSGSTITYTNGVITVQGGYPAQGGNPGTGYTALVSNLFPNPTGPDGVSVSWVRYAWAYTYLPAREVYVYSSNGLTDTPVGIFTNGG